MRIAYGIEVADEGDQYVAAAEAASVTFSEAFVPGAFLVETFPILSNIPSWFPGAGFKRKAAVWKKIAHNMRDAPFETTMESWVGPHRIVLIRHSIMIFDIRVSCMVGQWYSRIVYRNRDDGNCSTQRRLRYFDRANHRPGRICSGLRRYVLCYLLCFNQATFHSCGHI